MSYWSVVESVLLDHGIKQDWMSQHTGLIQGRQTGRLRCADYESLLLMALNAFGQKLGVEAGQEALVDVSGGFQRGGAVGVEGCQCAHAGTPATRPD